MVARPFDAGIGTLILPAADVTEAQALPGRAAHGASPADIVRGLYPLTHVIRGLSGAPDTTVGEVTDAALSAGPHWISPLESLDNVASPHALPWLVARLRAPDGCPWDREQDHLSLRKFLIEEAYEVHDALERGSTPDLAEELGDLLLQIVLHAHYSAEAGVFDLTDVYRNVVTKIVRRHPHVFGDVVADSAAEVVRNWEQIKAEERLDRGESSAAGKDGVPRAFAGLSRSLPALAYAQEMQERAASLGYDWPSVEGVLDKVAEEARELVAADSDAHRREEFGDLLMVLVNLARRSGIDAESALRASSAKFSTRFAHVERQAAERVVELRNLTFDELDELWDNAKEATAPAAAVGGSK
ncbi:MAG TPA: nucleoside triphosphate pyrophosphohydrolase [Candidatus Limnocylindrales bacterium]|nr:nucleoside triphosphate pyrophosphohydrolase [Candidatus Limnocylindrales bacterium]